MRLICVDDEKLVLHLTVSMCKELPQITDVKSFSRAPEALAWLQENDADIALLDINMPEMDGITLASKIKELKPDIAIIFLTGYSEYAVEAFSLHVSGYLMKPITQEQLEAEVEYALSGREKKQESHILVRTFGEFDVWVDGKPVSFSRAKAKELLAYLIDRQGSSITRANAFATLWENGVYDRSMQKQLDVVIRSLKDTLRDYGIEEILEVHRGSLRIRPEMIDCDLYRFFEGDVDAVNSYRGEYMNAYSWASMTESSIER